MSLDAVLVRTLIKPSRQVRLSLSTAYLRVGLNDNCHAGYLVFPEESLNKLIEPMKYLSSKKKCCY